MGSIWLVNLPEWLEDGGLQYQLYDNSWETRARSSGGYDAIYAIGYHHDASSPGSSDKANEDYCWRNADSRPIGAVRLRRNGVVAIGAAGATNTMGKGGPLTCSDGTVPRDKGNQYMFAIEAANNGQGERWPKAQVDAYFKLCAVLCDRLGLAASDCFSHYAYCQPSCPGRKIDPAGPTPDYPDLGGTSGAKTWSTSAFRSYVADRMGTGPAPPQPGPSPDTPTGAMAMKPIIGKYPNHGVWVVSFDGGYTHKAIRNSDWANLIVLDGAIDARSRAVVKSWSSVPDFTSTAEAEKMMGKKVG